MNAGIKSSVRSKSDYRRGTVLGLTVAEVFILLLFLLMLVFLILAQEWQSQETAVTEQLQEVLPRIRENPDVWLDALEGFEAPEEIVTLRREKIEAQRRVETLHNALEEAELRREETEKEIQQAREEARQVVVARDEALEQVEMVAQELRVLREKGQNPPCWYEKVPNNAGGEREKAYYTFEVAVFDDNMVVRQLAPPPGGAVDDNGTDYASEAERLQLERVPYGTPLDDEAVVRHLQPIHDAGKGARVRSYSCTFFIRVWDETSPEAKARWKHAHDRILEGLFGTFTVSEDIPWQDGH